MTAKTANIIELHTKKNLSTAKIALLYNVPKNSIIKLLQYHKVLKKAPGRNIEEQVFTFMNSLYPARVKHYRGDWPYDITIDTAKYDIKSASYNNGAYRFEVQHRDAVGKKTSNDVDYLILVLLDTKDMYELPFRTVETLRGGLTLRKSFGKYKDKMRYLGKL